MQRDGQGSERERFPRIAANDNPGSQAGAGGGPEARIDDAVMRLARMKRQARTPSHPPTRRAIGDRRASLPARVDVEPDGMFRRGRVALPARRLHLE